MHQSCEMEPYPRTSQESRRRGSMEDVLADEPNRLAPAARVSARFARLPRSGTKPEMALRRALYAAGLRFRVQVRVPGNNRRTVDIAFTRAKLAVFVDGCFWHGCPDHFPAPRTNGGWWRWKVETNRARDADTDRLLRKAGWTVVRVWEHEDIATTVDQIVELWRQRVGTVG